MAFIKTLWQWLGKNRKEVRDAFIFPPLADDKNSDMAAFLDNCNSVAIHARRGDMLGINGYCYKYGYFKRAVKYIKKKVETLFCLFL